MSDNKRNKFEKKKHQRVFILGGGVGLGIYCRNRIHVIINKLTYNIYEIGERSANRR